MAKCRCCSDEIEVPIPQNPADWLRDIGFLRRRPTVLLCSPCYMAARTAGPVMTQCAIHGTLWDPRTVTV